MKIDNKALEKELSEVLDRYGMVGAAIVCLDADQDLYGIVLSASDEMHPTFVRITNELMDDLEDALDDVDLAEAQPAGHA